MKSQSSRGGSRAGYKNKYNAVKNSTNPKRPNSSAAQKRKGR